MGELSLKGLTTITPEAARALAKHRGGTLFLDGLTTLSDEASEALARHEESVHLSGLAQLSPKAAETLRSRPNIRLPAKLR